MNLKALAIIAFASVIAGTVHAQQSTEDDIKARIAPVGRVHVAGAEEKSAAASGPRSGSDVYGGACIACHGAGVLNAPKKGDAGDWGPRLEKGLDTLLKHALEGFNAMPAKGTCMNCSDEEIKAAIEFMTEGL